MSRANRMNNQSFNHQAAFVAVRICIAIPSKHGVENATGTGFFYVVTGITVDDDLQSKLLLVSNKHVLLEGQWPMTLTPNRRRKDGSPDLGTRVNLQYRGFADRYIGHPDPNVDLACVDVSDITHSDAYIGRIGDNFLTPIDYDKVALGNDVLFVGYPNDRYDVVNNLPLLRKGTLASMPNVDFNGKGEIVIDAQVFPGSSGSPVFVDWDDTYKLLGVISRTMLRDASIGESDESLQPILGLGIVIKQRHVQELITHAKNKFSRGLNVGL